MPCHLIPFFLGSGEFTNVLCRQALSDRAETNVGLRPQSKIENRPPIHANRSRYLSYAGPAETLQGGLERRPDRRAALVHRRPNRRRAHRLHRRKSPHPLRHPDELRARWIDTTQRAEILQHLAERGIDFQQVALQAGHPDADPFDLLCHLAFDAPILTRRQRADRVKKDRAEFFDTFGPEAREILTDLLEKYADDGELSFSLPDVLKVPPVSQHGNVNEIIAKFGDSAKLRSAVNQLQSLLYAS